MPFRERLPIRRTTPSQNPTGDNWGHHKPDLKEDFNSRCGYCDSHDNYRHTYFEVDHFIPKSFFLTVPPPTLSVTDYKNLVYTCKFCNNKKSDKWPSQSINVFHNSQEGFVDPCNVDYDNHFYRTEDGGIMWNSDLGKWMFSHAFKFDERLPAIKALWNLSKLEQSINALAIVLETYDEASQKHKEIKIKIGDFCFEYFRYHQELIRFYNSH